MFWGRRAGRNPPSVLSSIHLVGVPAPPAELTGAYCSFHSAAGTRFILHQSLLEAHRKSSSHGTSKVSFLRPRTESPRTVYPLRLRHVGGVSSRPATGPVTAHRLTAHPSRLATIVILCREASELISLRAWAPPGPNTLGDWGPRAKRLDRSLDAYTPAPSTPSSLGALVQSYSAVASA